MLHKYCKPLKHSLSIAGFEVITAVTLNCTVFWDVMMCRPSKFRRQFCSACYVSLASFLLALLFDTENGGYMFIRNYRFIPGYSVTSQKVVLFTA